MVDTHCHILPGIDDGAGDLDDSLELCRIAAEDGIRMIVTTPHVMEFRYPNNRKTIEKAYGALNEALEGLGLDLRLIRGAEVHAAADLVARLKNGDLLTYADNRRYMLLEFPFQQVVSGTEEIVYRLRLAGVTPVIAHPERIGYFMQDPERLGKLVRLGALAQVTGGSLLGHFGERSERAGWRMVERRLVHVVASDAHDTRHRRPELRRSVEALAERVGEEEARRMSEEIPAAIVEGREVEVPEPVPEEKGLRGFLGRLFSRS
jgi:protein-tyrosine phosphatase